ncbi:hypothetical protein [Pectobacterium aroidearum]|uniref:hypothetical protein n=1 Tax=Pectobacterium aroidearum TaxID=1201031 RepID=UPI0021753200|nr:hypothetical protein [Pectobacterium aroidearum]
MAARSSAGVNPGVVGLKMICAAVALSVGRDMATVNNCEYLENGAKRLYHFNDGSLVKEHPALPGKSRLEFYDARGNRIYKPAVLREMKQAIERHKKFWRVS